MGKHSNIILLDPDADMSPEDFILSSGSYNNIVCDSPQQLTGRVIDCIKRIYENVSRVRQMFPGEAYTMPPPGKGISPLMEEEAAMRPLPYYEALAEKHAYTPLLYNDESGIRDFHVFDLKVYAALRAEECASVSSMLEAFYESKERAGRLRQKYSDLSQPLKARLEKLRLKKQRLHEDIERSKDAGAYKLRGELITANIHMIKVGAAEASLTDYTSVSEENPQGNQLRVTLDPKLTPSQNAQRYFKRYHKEKNALAYKLEQLKTADEELAFLESTQMFLENADSDVQIDELRDELSAFGYIKPQKHGNRRPSTRPAFLEYKSSSGRKIYVGRNNRENDELTLKKAQPNDTWLHTKDIPGSHVILSGAEPPDSQSLWEAACLAAYYSKGRQSENVPVDYTQVKHVKKPSGAKPGMVIFTNNKTLYVTPQLPV
jgi:predicted ribosome quality control (RQC) complex YloA/Tae2 family protein